MGKLENAIHRFDAASSGRLLYLGLEWSTMGKFVAALRRYYEQAVMVALPASVDRELSEMFNIQRRLMALPVSPANESVGLISFLEQPLAAIASDSLTAARQQVIECLQQLRDEAHVAQDLNLLVTEKLRGVDFEGKTVAVLVPRGLRDLAHEVIHLENAKSVDIVSLSELRRLPMRDMVIVFGSPEDQLWQKEPIENRRASVSWIYSAPAGKNTITISWTGHSSFDLSHYSVWKESPLAASEVVGSVAFTVAPAAGHVSAPREVLTADPDGVDATLVDLVGGGSIAFHPEFGPKPQVLEIEELEFEVRYVKVRSLEPRQVLIFRTDDSEISFIRQTAQKSMGKTKYENAKKVSESFKANVQKASLSSSAPASLRSNGIENAEYYLNVASDARYIGPKDFETATKIAAALGFAITNDEFSLLTEMRSHHRTAGAKANELVRAALADSHEWEDAISGGLQAHIDLGDVGTVVIAVVESLGTIKRKVSRLGIAERLPKSEEYVMKIGLLK